jgi:hypothetical protein
MGRLVKVPLLWQAWKRDPTNPTAISVTWTLQEIPNQPRFFERSKK